MRAALAGLLLLAAPAVAEPITGRPTVTDGDTLVIRDTRIRLHGIDAPETAQWCQDASGKSYRAGQFAAFALADRIWLAPIACEPRDTDRYGRTVAVCRKDGEDLNGWMVAQGHAIAYRRYSTDYVAQEAEARAARRGIWSGTCQEPSAWRRERREGGRQKRAVADPPPAPAGCAIKGNINRKGECIYHEPGSRDYDRVKIDRPGERMFCTTAEAKAAGCRAPRR